MSLSKKEHLPFVQHVGIDGVFRPEMNDFAGMHVKPIDDPQATDVELVFPGHGFDQAGADKGGIDLALKQLLHEIQAIAAMKKIYKLAWVGAKRLDENLRAFH